MTILFNKTRLFACCLVLSVLVHILSYYAWRMLGTYHFSAPVNQPQAVMVDLGKSTDTVHPDENSEEQESSSDHDEEAVTSEDDLTPDSETKLSHNEQRQPASPETDDALSGSNKSVSATRSSEATNPPVEPRQKPTSDSNLPPLSMAGNFLATKNEKLTYLISMYGLPVGSAELEANNKNGEIWLTLRVKSNTAISSVFPVDDVVEIRHIDGRFIMTTIKQQEGSFKGDQGFTINLRKKRVSWIDNISGRSLTMTVPSDEVLDTLSGFYYLRNRQLQIGKTEMLHIFDSETYADVPVEILRRETMRLPNLQKIDTLVVRPLQQTAGIFRRTGDILIWMTDDAYKVPVKIVTSVALGTVTVELMSAESTPPEEKVTKSK